MSYELVHSWLTAWARKHALLNALTNRAKRHGLRRLDVALLRASRT